MLKPLVFASVAVLVAAFMTQLSSFADERPLSVCEVLSNLDRHRGKLIVIEGILSGGDRHGLYLKDRTEDKTCAAVVAKGQTWPSWIALDEYTKGADVEDGPVNFESDVKQIDNMLAEAKRRTSGSNDSAAVVTLIGQLRSRKNIKIVRNDEGWYMGTGYAQSGQYPALLIIKSVQDVKITKRPTP
jgi:hypothetical protein